MKYWSDVIRHEMNKQYLQDIQKKMDEAERKGILLLPKRENIFNALKYCKLAKTKVVILGQDPYPNPNHAHGLAFSVPKDINIDQIPKSLKNILRELKQDCKIVNPKHGDLTCWAKQGVLLLNTILTVEKGKTLSHESWQWQKLTIKFLKILNDFDKCIVFVLWGSYAQSYKHFINNKQHFVLSAPHPSPLSAYRGFFNCKHFSSINKILNSNSRSPIVWDII